MSLSTFVCQLFETGRVRVAPPSLLSASQLAEADDTLVAFERDFRRELPAEAPSFSLAASRWGALAIFHACQFLVYRDTDAKLVSETLTAACPEPPNPSTHYSVDLVLRFLPDAARLARGVNSNDPLVEQLASLASHWPLSSIGMSDVTPVSLSGVIDHPCLLALYVDRVISTRDIARLTDPRVRMAVHAAIGLHDQLAPEIAAALRIQTTEESLL